MLKVILHLYDKCKYLVNVCAIPVSQITKSGIFDTVIKIKYDIDNEQLDKFDDITKQIDELKF